MARRMAKLVLAATLAFGVFKGTEAGFDPEPGRITPAFNQVAAPQAGAPIREYKVSSLAIPPNVDEVWRIRLGSWEMSGGGHHTFLEFAPYKEASKANPSGDDVYQIQGIAMDNVRYTYAVLNFRNTAAYSRYAMGDYVLKAFGVNQDHNRKVFGKEPMSYVDVHYGSKDDVLKMYMDALQLTEDINRKSDGYELLDHNSNSVQRTLLDGLGIPVPGLYAAHQLNTLTNQRIWTPGMDRTLLPPGWDRQKLRESSSYAHLSGDALEAAARAASPGADAAVWAPERAVGNPKVPKLRPR
jgi:hypothetical protein